MKRVAIIGAGPCGLAALKEMREAGHEAVLYERSSALGGIFASAAVYPSLHLTISNWAMAFSDFPDPKRLCYSSANEYLQYLEEYARHFDLERHICYHSEV
jgi:dimethylaniline monooxygenase (N-oxide forming)